MPRAYIKDRPAAPECAIHHAPLEYAGTFDGHHAYECRLHTRNGPCSVTQWVPVEKEKAQPREAA